MTFGSRRHRKSDSNAAEIVKTLRAMGFKVYALNDIVDLIVQLNGRTVLCEVRPADKPRIPRPGPQAEFHAEFKVHWLQTAEDCRALRRMMLRQLDA